MTTFTKIHQINRISKMVKLGARMTPKEIASQLNIAESSLYNLIRICKDLGMDLKFNRTSGKYESKDKKYIKIEINDK